MRKLISTLVSCMALANFNNLALADNIAPLAEASATSTYCTGANPSMHCYDAARVNDGDTSTRLGGLTSWANNRNTPRPQTWSAVWPSFVKLENASVFTSEGYPISEFDLQYYDYYVEDWVTLRSVRGNKALRVDINFNAVHTDRIRVVGYRGPDRQYTYVRLNEVVINGDASYL